MKKKLAIFICMSLLLFTLTSCGKSLEDQISEGLTESLINSQLEDGASVDIDGDTVVVEGEDGESYSYGGTEWPSSDVAKLIPKLNAGTVTYVMESEDYAMVTIEEVTEDDFVDYVSDLEAEGYTEEVTTMNSDGTKYYYAADTDGNNVAASYTEEDNSIYIQISAYVEE